MWVFVHRSLYLIGMKLITSLAMDDKMDVLVDCTFFCWSGVLLSSTEEEKEESGMVTAARSRVFGVEYTYVAHSF
jgi:hypothetical protein